LARVRIVLAKANLYTIHEQVLFASFNYNLPHRNMPKKKTGARKKAEKLKKRQKDIRSSTELRSIVQQPCNLLIVSIHRKIVLRCRMNSLSRYKHYCNSNLAIFLCIYVHGSAVTPVFSSDSMICLLGAILSSTLLVL